MVGPAIEVIDRLGTHCTDGGSFYVCNDKPVQFVGCCTLDPCKTTDGNCPDNNLRNTTFNAYSYSQIKAQQCVSNDPEVQWFACAATVPPFMGCCSANACQLGGCPTDKLHAAKLNKNPDFAKPFLSDTPAQGLSTGATIGISVGATLAVMILIIGSILWLGVQKRRKTQEPARSLSHIGSVMTDATPVTELKPPSSGTFSPAKLGSHSSSKNSPPEDLACDLAQQTPFQQAMLSPSLQSSSSPHWQGQSTHSLHSPRCNHCHHQPSDGNVPSCLSVEYGDERSDAWNHLSCGVQELPAENQILELEETRSLSSTTSNDPKMS